METFDRGKLRNMFEKDSCDVELTFEVCRPTDEQIFIVRPWRNPDNQGHGEKCNSLSEISLVSISGIFNCL